MATSSKTEARLSEELWALRARVAELERAEAERKRAEKVLRSIVEGTASATGDRFFRPLVRCLGSALAMRYAFVGEVVDARQEKVKTLAVWTGDDFADNFEYELAGTPCEDVVRRQTCYHATGVQELFPRDRVLAELGVESYLGTPLRAASGQVLGLLVVMHDQPMDGVADVEAILTVFAARAAAELERKRAEEALRQSEASLARAQQIAHLGNWDWDVVGNRVVWSDEMYRIFGLAPQEFGATYEAFLSFVHSEDRARVERAVEGVLSDNQPYDLDFRIIRSDGKVRWLHAHATVAFDEDGRPIRLVGTTLDITQRKRAEETLVQSARASKRLAGLLVSMNACRTLEEMLTPLLDTSLEVCRMDGGGVYLVDGEHAVMRRHRGLPAAFVRQVERMRLSLPVVKAVLNAGGPVNIDEVSADLTGLFRAHGLRHVYSVPLRAGGEVFGFLNVASTRTGAPQPSAMQMLGILALESESMFNRLRAEEALRRSEERFRLFTSAVTDVIYRYDPLSDKYDFISRSFEAQTGYSLDEIKASPREMTKRITHPDDAPRVFAEASGLVSKGPGAGPYRTEYRLIRKDGKIIWVEDRKDVEWTPDGKVHRINGVVRDITARKQAEEELAKYRDHLEELVQERTRELAASREELRRSERLASIGTLAAGMAHQINNPVGSILLSAENALALMPKEQTGETAERLLGRIVEDARRCGQIVRSVLQFARQEQTEKWASDLNEVARRAVELCRKYADERGATIKLRGAQGPVPMVMNPIGIEQALVNLIRNAVESGEGGVRVDVRLERTADAVRIAVADNGRGIAEAQKARLFDPFYTTRQQEGGTGLGLSITHGIVAEHGGTIDIESEPGRGTIVTIHLPPANETAGRSDHRRPKSSSPKE